MKCEYICAKGYLYIKYTYNICFHHPEAVRAALQNLLATKMLIQNILGLACCATMLCTILFVCDTHTRVCVFYDLVIIKLHTHNIYVVSFLYSNFLYDEDDDDDTRTSIYADSVCKNNSAYI